MEQGDVGLVGVGRMALMVLSFLILACGCSRNTPNLGPEVKYSPRIDSVVKAVECLIGGSVIPEKEIKGQAWLKDGKINPTLEFSEWYADRHMSVYGGKELDSWTNEVIEVGPDWRCPFS